MEARRSLEEDGEDIMGLRWVDFGDNSPKKGGGGTVLVGPHTLATRASEVGFGHVTKSAQGQAISPEVHFQTHGHQLIGPQDLAPKIRY